MIGVLPFIVAALAVLITNRLHAPVWVWYIVGIVGLLGIIVRHYWFSPKEQLYGEK
jgi:hypothetical protein